MEAKPDLTYDEFLDKETINFMANRTVLRPPPVIETGVSEPLPTKR